jgi:hypothetical protein
MQFEALVGERYSKLLTEVTHGAARSRVLSSMLAGSGDVRSDERPRSMDPTRRDEELCLRQVAHPIPSALPVLAVPLVAHFGWLHVGERTVEAGDRSCDGGRGLRY